MSEDGDRRVAARGARRHAGECGALRRERAAHGRVAKVEERVATVAAVATVPRYGRLAPGTAWRPPVVPQWSGAGGAAENGSVGVGGVGDVGVGDVADVGAGHEARTVRVRANRRLLLLAAARCFAARGYSGASLSDILAETGRDRARPLTKGAFYAHFESKYDLGRCVVDEACTSWVALVDSLSAAPAPGRGKSDPVWDVLAISDSAAGTAMYDPVARAAWRLRLDDDAFAAAMTRLAEGNSERLIGLLARARDLRLLRDSVDPVRVVDHISTLFAGHLTRTESAPDAVTPDLWDRLSTTWRQVLPAIGTESWLAAWRTSGWAWRPRPDAEAFDRARRLAVA